MSEYDRIAHLEEQLALALRTADRFADTIIQQKDLLAAAQRERDEAIGLLSKLVKEADEGNPFCSVGHFVEHVIPEARKLTGQPEKPPEDTTALKDQMLYVGGSDRAFRCECGCNVFKEYKPNRYRCNSCKETYTGEWPVTEPSP